MMMDEPDGNASGVLPSPASGMHGAQADSELDVWSSEPTMSGSPVAPSGQLSATGGHTEEQITAPRTGQVGRYLPWLRILLLVALMALILGGGVFAFVQTGLPVTGGITGTQTHQSQTSATKIQREHQAHQQPANPQTTPGFDWVPARLPAGWTAANLTTADALEAERSAMTFVDREMALDFRDAGTAAQPGGTFTAATFLLTLAARQRFQQNDVRVASPALFNSIQQRQLIQEVINGQPTLVQFQVQGQQQFAWVNVAFQLFQSQLGNNGQRVEGKEVTAMGQPVTHHMGVLLIRIPPQQQGANAPMGGTGWLVSNYALDSAALPTIVQPA